LNSELIAACLSETTCHQASFEGANLSETVLVNSNFREAVFDKADFRFANLSNSQIDGASFYGAKNLSIEQVKSTRGWKYAKFDPLFQLVLSLDSLAMFLSSRLNRWLN
jgi:hypothetical protein